MKKILLLFVSILLALCFAACNDIPEEPVSVYDEPKATAAINEERKDKETDITIFEEWSERDSDANFHYKIEGEDSKYDVRIRVEIRHGEDDHNIEEEYETLSDKIVTKKSGKWHNEEIFLAASVYFYRVTLYHGEDVLVTKTFYTPRKEAVYSEIPQEVPEYRSMEFTEKEQEFYDLSSYAIFDFAKENEYSNIYGIKGWFSDDGTKLYLEVEFRSPWSEYFEIDVNDPTDYLVSYEPFDVEGFEEALPDYYYVMKEFKKNL